MKDKKDIANCFYTIGKMEYLGVSTEAQAVARFAKDLLPLFTERTNSDAYKTALLNLKSRARNVNELIEDKN
jgi:hypothetical protein